MGMSDTCNEDCAADVPTNRLIRRWTVLRERCTSELCSVDRPADRRSVTVLRGAVVKLEAEIASYQMKQDPLDQYWLGIAAAKMLSDTREAIRNVRCLLDSVMSNADGDDFSDGDFVSSCQSNLDSIDADDEGTFVLSEYLTDDVKLERPHPVEPSARYEHTRALRTTLQGSLLFGVDRETGEHVAIKLSSKAAVSRQESLTGDKVLEDPINEMRMLEALRDPGHPNVVRLIDTFEDDVHHWMVLEFCSGGEFFDVISESGRLSELLAAKYFYQLITALDYIHGRNICHLDLSLENLLLDQNGDLRVTDFGLARVFDDVYPFQACSLTKPGKIAYMSPEIFSGKEFHGQKADLYSSGVILFVMLFGCPPYELPALSDRRFRLMFCGEIRELLRRWQMTSSALALDLLSGLLCDADDRFTIGDVLSHPWLASQDVMS